MMKTCNTELQKVWQEGTGTLKKRFNPLKDSTAWLGCGFVAFCLRFLDFFSTSNFSVLLCACILAFYESFALAE